jgi:hypothetical protein
LCDVAQCLVCGCTADVARGGNCIEDGFVKSCPTSRVFKGKFKRTRSKYRRASVGSIRDLRFHRSYPARFRSRGHYYVNPPTVVERTQLASYGTLLDRVSHASRKADKNFDRIVMLQHRLVNLERDSQPSLANSTISTGQYCPTNPRTASTSPYQAQANTAVAPTYSPLTVSTVTQSLLSRC